MGRTSNGRGLPWPLWPWMPWRSLSPRHQHAWLDASLAWAAGLDTDTWLRSVSSRAPIRAVRLGVFVLVAAALSSPVFDLIGVQIPGMDWAALTAWLLGPGLRVLLVVLLAYLLLRILGLAVERLETELRPDESSAPTSLEDIRRATTLGRLIRSVLSVVIVGVAGLIVLRELQVDIMPILTGAGILGAGRRIRGTDARQGRDCWIFSDTREPGVSGRRGTDQWDRRVGRGHQDPYHRVAGPHGGRARVPQMVPSRRLRI